jgi:polyhydroxyalkanoate synthase
MQENAMLGSASEMIDLWRKLNDARAAVAAIDPSDVEIATTPKDMIARDGTVRLYRYRPVVANPVKIPVILAYALVGRFTVADLSPDRSLIRRLLEEGLDIYAIDWGHPRPVDCCVDLEDYICGYIDDFVDLVRERAGIDKVNLLGICQGGIFHTIYASLFPEKVNAVTTTVAPFDFHANIGDEKAGRGLIHFWASALKAADVDLAVDATGNLSGDLMAQYFGFMTPVSSMTKYGVDLAEIAADETQLKSFLSMERWLSDRPAHTAASLRQWIKDFYIENKLARGEFMLGDKKIDLGNVVCPILNIYGEHDVIAPPACSTALRELVGTKDYTEIAFPGGHIGIFVGRRAQTTLSPAIANWFRERSH